MTIYGAYDEVSRKYYVQDGTYKEYKKFFENELDCARFCVKNQYKYDSIYVEPDSKKLTEEHYKMNSNYLSMMGH